MATSFKRKFALGISNIGNPFTLLLILTSYVSLHFLPWHEAARVILIILVCAMVPTFLFIVLNVRTGKYSNYDVSTQKQRPSLYLFSIFLSTGITLTFYFMHEHAFVIKGCVASLVLLITSFLVNMRLKCSLHTGFALFTAVALYRINGYMGLCFFIFAGLMAWSRLSLERHTPREVVIGGLMGGSIGGLFFWLL